MIRHLRLVFLTLALAVTAAQAEMPHLSLGPHEHDVGQLNLVLDGNELLLELLAPAGNIAGFEHLPVTVKERMAVRRVAAELSQADRLFALPTQAGCTLAKAEVDGEQMEAIGHKHDHDHAAHSHDSHAHAEYHAIYHYTCRQPQALAHVDVKLFAAYRTLTRLRWQAVLPGGAQAGELTPAAATLSLRDGR